MKALCVVMALFAFGCDDDVKSEDMGLDASVNNDGGTPAVPQLGDQIDRLGRPGVNTALTAPFDIAALQGGLSKDMARDAYNAAGDDTMWAAKFAAQIRTHLAIYDGVSGTCGDQLAADAAGDAGMRYSFLAGVLADDRLWVDTTKTACAQYLGVEAAALGIALDDCGGRAPTVDVIDRTYTVLFSGVGGLATPDTDGVSNDSNITEQTFPFLAAPN